MKAIYFDYAAATPTDPRVLRRMAEVAAAEFGNPSSRHGVGQRAEQLLSEARQTIAEFLGAKPEEVYFTASGTEANNLAVLGVAKANKNRGRHIITTTIEHPSVLNACRALERDGFEITYLPVSADGLVQTSDFRDAIRPDTILASIHLANSEVGVIQPIEALTTLARDAGVYFHTDACQASAYRDLAVAELGVDLLTLNGSKMYGPRGSAVLYVRSGVPIFPLVFGGGQEQSLRSGTENVPAICGLAAACRIAAEERTRDARRIAQVRDALQKDLEAIGCRINCSRSPRLPNHLSVTIPTQESDVVATLDRFGLAISSGSACSSRSQTDSHVLTAIGLSSEHINRTVRVSLGRPTTISDSRALIAAIDQIR